MTYNHIPKYDESLALVFESTRNACFVTLYNLNYYGKEEKAGLEEEKQAFEEGKTGFADKKQAFEATLTQIAFTKPTKENIWKLFELYRDTGVFSRKDVMSATTLTATPATELITKMKNADLIEPAKGQGRGKYRFRSW